MGGCVAEPTAPRGSATTVHGRRVHTEGVAETRDAVDVVVEVDDSVVVAVALDERVERRVAHPDTWYTPARAVHPSALFVSVELNSTGAVSS